VDVPLDSWSREVEGLGVGKVGGPILRSGLDSVGRGTPEPTPPGSATGPISFLPSLRARRSFRGRESKFRTLSRRPMLSLGRWRWWRDNGWLASWLSFHFEQSLSAEKIRHSADIRQSGFSSFGFPFRTWGHFHLLPVLPSVLFSRALGWPATCHPSLVELPLVSLFYVFTMCSIPTPVYQSLSMYLRQLYDLCDRFPKGLPDTPPPSLPTSPVLTQRRAVPSCASEEELPATN
jgi:hypothetical protein